jgi:hypothetical protein
LDSEIHEKGTDRDKLILELFSSAIILRRNPDSFLAKPVLPEEVKQFRSKIELMSNEQIREELLKHQDYGRPDPATATFS